jgi:Zn finger protein HypA/HybF involved in hydrogenase expression
MRCRLEGITPEDGKVFCHECQKSVSYKTKEYLDEIDSKPLTPEEIRETEAAWAKRTEQDVQKDAIAQIMLLDIAVVCGNNKRLTNQLKRSSINTLENITKKSAKDLTDIGVKIGEVGHITRKLKEFGLNLRTI